LASKSYQLALATISPGSEACGSTLPKTEHSTSRPDAEASTITRGSWRSASSTAASSSSSRSTRVMPTLEPRREGLTQSGSPICSQRPHQSLPSTAVNSTCGTPWAAKSRFSVTLSMQIAEERTSEPT
jgi:hypothetical protein